MITHEDIQEIKRVLGDRVTYSARIVMQGRETLTPSLPMMISA